MNADSEQHDRGPERGTTAARCIATLSEVGFAALQRISARAASRRGRARVVPPLPRAGLSMRDDRHRHARDARVMDLVGSFGLTGAVAGWMWWAAFLTGLTGCERQSVRDPVRAAATDPAGTVVVQAPIRADAATLPAPKVALVPPTNMVLIRAGTFQRIRFPVTLSRDYWIGACEVTQAEYESVVGKNPSHFAGNPRRPVEKVSFADATRYCALLTRRESDAGRLPSGFEYRLPTEAEWEYACRAGSTNLFSFGADPAVAAEYAWTAENSDAATHPVGEKKANAWGLHDMHGNVWELCLDWFEPYPAQAVADPKGPDTGKFKVFKGGGWNQELEYARAVNRFMIPASNGIHFVGFRVVLGPRP